MSELGIYDEMAARASAAYTAFSKHYETEHPAPERAALTRDVVSVAIVVSLLVVMVAGVVVSSSRTINEFGGGGVGVGAFIMLEGGLVAYAFFRARRAAAESNRVGNARRLATVGLTLAFVSALAANIHAVLRAQDIETPAIVNTVINLFVAVSAPTLAFISADVLAIELMSGDARRRAAEAQHEAAMNEWRAGLQDEWQRRQRVMGVSWKVERVEASPQLSAEIDVNLRKNTSIDRPSPKLQAAIEWLEAHPEHLRTESRKLGELIGVSHATANKAQHHVMANTGNGGATE